jgi:hypothetical protein
MHIVAEKVKIPTRLRNSHRVAFTKRVPQPEPLRNFDERKRGVKNQKQKIWRAEKKKKFQDKMEALRKYKNKTNNNL